MPRAATIRSTIEIDGDALIWTLIGIRPGSSQTGDVGRPAHWGVHTRARRQERERWQSILLAALGRKDVADQWVCPRPAALTIRMWGPSPPDTPNMGGHAKYLVDALVTLGFLVKDSPKYVPRTITEVPSPRPDGIPPGPGCDIRIEPL